MAMYKNLFIITIALLSAHKAVGASRVGQFVNQLRLQARSFGTQSTRSVPTAIEQTRGQRFAIPLCRYNSSIAINAFPEASEEDQSGYERQDFFNRRRALALGGLGAATLAAYAVASDDSNKNRFIIPVYADEPKITNPEIEAFINSFNISQLPSYLVQEQRYSGTLPYMLRKYPQYRQQLVGVVASNIIQYIVDLASYPGNPDHLLTFFAQYPESREAIIAALTNKANLMRIIKYEYPNQNDNGAIYYGVGGHTLYTIMQNYPEYQSRITAAVESNFENILSRNILPTSIRAFLDVVINQSPTIVLNNTLAILRHNHSFVSFKREWDDEYQPEYYYPVIENLAELHPELRTHIIKKLFDLALTPNELEKSGAEIWYYVINTLIKKYPELSDSIVNLAIELIQEKPKGMSDAMYVHKYVPNIIMLGRAIMENYPEHRNQFWEVLSNNILLAKTAVYGSGFSTPDAPSYSAYDPRLQKPFRIDRMFKNPQAFLKLRNHQPLDPWDTFIVVKLSLPGDIKTAKKLFKANHVDQHYFITLLLNPLHYHVVPQLLDTKADVAKFLPDILKAIDEAAILPKLYEDYENNKYSYHFISERRDAAAAIINQWLAMPEFKQIVQNELAKARQANPMFDGSFKGAKKIIANDYTNKS